MTRIPVRKRAGRAHVPHTPADDVTFTHVRITGGFLLFGVVALALCTFAWTRVHAIRNT